jgi:hypothetical protein
MVRFVIKHLLTANKRFDPLADYQGRFKGILVQKDSHFLEVCRYVVLNPVGAKTISHPQLYKWSSYPATAGTAQVHPCLTPDEILDHFGHRKPVAQQNYREFVQDGIGSSSIWDDLEARACWESKALPKACAILSPRSSRSERYRKDKDSLADRL